MPLYRFALQGNDPTLDEPPEWFRDEVEALKALGRIAAELSRNNSGATQFIAVTRASNRPKSQL